MSTETKTVLITGCSDGGLGSALAIAFHEAGAHVYATARNPTKLKQAEALGIETLILDVLDDKSIKECVSKVPHLDILINNAGAGYTMPISDISIPEAKKQFDLNVWSYIAVTQAFTPLLLKSKGIIVHNTSVASVSSLPFQATYSASKSAMASFAEAQRLELQPFGVRVVDLKTGAVTSNFFSNTYNQKAADESDGHLLPADSIYSPARDAVEKMLRGDELRAMSVPAKTWAHNVASDLLRPNPPYQIWRGGQAWQIRIGSMLPLGLLDGMIKKITGLDIVERAVNK